MARNVRFLLFDYRFDGSAEAAVVAALGAQGLDLIVICTGTGFVGVAGLVGGGQLLEVLAVSRVLDLILLSAGYLLPAENRLIGGQLYLQRRDAALGGSLLVVAVATFVATAYGDYLVVISLAAVCGGIGVGAVLYIQLAAAELLIGLGGLGGAIDLIALCALDGLPGDHRLALCIQLYGDDRGCYLADDGILVTHGAVQLGLLAHGLHLVIVLGVCYGALISIGLAAGAADLYILTLTGNTAVHIVLLCAGDGLPLQNGIAGGCIIGCGNGGSYAGDPAGFDGAVAAGIAGLGANGSYLIEVLAAGGGFAMSIALAGCGGQLLVLAVLGGGVVHIVLLGAGNLFPGDIWLALLQGNGNIGGGAHSCLGYDIAEAAAAIAVDGFYLIVISLAYRCGSIGPGGCLGSTDLAILTGFAGGTVDLISNAIAAGLPGQNLLAGSCVQRYRHLRCRQIQCGCASILVAVTAGASMQCVALGCGGGFNNLGSILMADCVDISCFEIIAVVTMSEFRTFVCTSCY